MSDIRSVRHSAVHQSRRPTALQSALVLLDMCCELDLLAVANPKPSLQRKEIGVSFLVDALSEAVADLRDLGMLHVLDLRVYHSS